MGRYRDRHAPADVTDLKEVEEYMQPDDGNSHTTAPWSATRLPRPLAPGEWVELEIDFSTPAARTSSPAPASTATTCSAASGSPRSGSSSPPGCAAATRPGWNAHQYHANSEFYADFGDYDVSLTLPARYQGRIGATGRRLEKRSRGTTATSRFVQPGVHDFAWTADPRYLVIEDLFDPATDVPAEQVERIAALLGVAPDELALDPVTIRLMLQPEHRSQAGRYIDVAKAALSPATVCGSAPTPTAP